MKLTNHATAARKLNACAEFHTPHLFPGPHRHISALNQPLAIPTKQDMKLTRPPTSTPQPTTKPALQYSKNRKPRGSKKQVGAPLYDRVVRGQDPEQAEDEGQGGDDQDVNEAGKEGVFGGVGVAGGENGSGESEDDCGGEELGGAEREGEGAREDHVENGVGSCGV
jgi:hypothetical protein